MTIKNKQGQNIKKLGINLMIIIAGLLVILMSSSPAFAASETYTSGYFEYIIEDESVSITGYFGKEESLEIPSSIAGYPVSTIKTGAFTSTKDLKLITLPDTIMSVESGAFKDSQQVIYPDWIDKETSDSVNVPTDNSSYDSEISPSNLETEGDGDVIDDDEPLGTSDDSEASESESSGDKTESSDPSKSDTKADTEEGTNDSVPTEQQNSINPLIYVISVVVLAVIAAVLVKLKHKK